MTTGIYTLQNVYDATYPAFKPPSRYRPGVRTLPLRHMRSDMRTETTLIVLRMTHREPRRVQKTQHQTRFTAGELAWRTEYHAIGATYSVAAIAWDTGAVTVLSQHATKADALAALRATTF